MLIFLTRLLKIKFWFFPKKLDVIVSDMAADTTGNKSLDSIRTNQLCYEIMNFSSQILKTNGILVSKLFMGDDFLEVKNLAKHYLNMLIFLNHYLAGTIQRDLYTL